jgi:RHH-type proline utilization regulon transcriptional repressor/proline dehydrogenase/delta 1-pyrroline-5-carboxylate dehydrogenase
MTEAELEPLVRAFGHEVFARLDRQGPVLFTKGWWDDKLMGLTMDNEALKVQLFRFVDTLPYLIHNDREIGRHLREYLGEAGEKLPWWARAGVRVLPDGGFGGRLLASAARGNATRMARKFIAGSNVEEALQAIARLRARGLAFTIDLLGEATITEAEADQVQKQYLDLIDGLSRVVNTWPEEPEIDRDDRGPIPRVNVSVKLSALYSQFDPIDPAGTERAVNARLRPILQAAKRHGAFVNFDMEQYAFKDVTLRIFRDILAEPEFRDWPDVGIAMQAYLKDTEADLHALLDWARDTRRTPVWVRLVKGAYWDYETVLAAQHGWPVPVFTEKWRTDANYEKLSTFLLENYDWLVPAFGSHNIRSIAHAMAVAETLKVPPRRYEFQMLYGMADPVKDAIRSLGYRVRVYTPYGQLLPGMAYLVRRLLENTSNDSFLRASFTEGVAEDLLLRNPAESSVAHRPSSLESSTMHTTNGPVQTRNEGPRTKDHGRFTNEPLTDFARAEGRRAMAAALEAIKPQLGRDYPLVIDNEPVQPAAWADSLNPSHFRQVVGRWGKATPEQANQAVASAQNALAGWRETPVAERAALLRRVAQRFRERRFELSAWIITETGKQWRESDADVAEAIDFCEYYAREAEKLWHPQHRDVPGEENVYYYEPRGVAAVIAPWNFPLAILTGMTVAAVVTGNPVVMKPAEQSTVVAAKFMECLLEAGLPPGVVNFLPGIGEEVGPVLVNHPDVALIAFTGSLKVGLWINEQAAKTPGGQNFVKKVIAEMGGKNAVIVDGDADLDEAVRGVVDSAFGYQGQKCSAGSRVIVLESIADQFLNRLVEATRSLTVAPAEDPGCAVGPVIDAESRDRVLAAIARGKTEARLAYQTDVGALADEGYYVGPAVFADVPPNAWVAQEEIFGPVLAVTRAQNLDEALRIANGTKYALTGGVFSRSPHDIEEVKRRFRVGNLYVNRKCTGALVDRQPFGGFNLSGIGSKAGGPDYLLQFVLPRTITENTLRRGFAPEVEEVE